MPIAAYGIRRCRRCWARFILGTGSEIRGVVTVPQAFSANLPCEEIVGEIHRELNAAGFHVAQSFDLRSARALLPSCTCPHHGTALCDCQYSVLRIYGQTSAPETLVIHGHDARCWIVIADNPNGRGTPYLVSEIVQVLAAARLIYRGDGESDG
jgi:hypothetical protein